MNCIGAERSWVARSREVSSSRKAPRRAAGSERSLRSTRSRRRCRSSAVVSTPRSAPSSAASSAEKSSGAISLRPHSASSTGPTNCSRVRLTACCSRPQKLVFSCCPVDATNLLARYSSREAEEAKKTNEAEEGGNRKLDFDHLRRELEIAFLDGLEEGVHDHRVELLAGDGADLVHRHFQLHGHLVGAVGGQWVARGGGAERRILYTSPSGNPPASARMSESLAPPPERPRV